jgi:hypothetical protein
MLGLKYHDEEEREGGESEERREGRCSTGWGGPRFAFVSLSLAVLTSLHLSHLPLKEDTAAMQDSGRTMPAAASTNSLA